MRHTADTLTFGSHLRRLRIAVGSTQAALAIKAGLSLNAVSSIERGARRYPYPDTVRALADALGLAPTERTEFISLASRRPGLDLPDEAAGANLPAPATTMVGRASEVAEAVALLRRPELRLLTMTGPGGVGKTRLALCVAEQAGAKLDGGVRFVPLAVVTDANLVIPAVVQTLALRGAANDQARDILVRFLADREMLLVLDNFEQVVDAAPGVVDLMVSCPRLKVLVTSRIPLHVDGEQEFPVRPLPLPSRNGSSTLPALPKLAEAPAVALFVQRARAVRPGFTLTPANAGAVTELCARLDGLPLAIELAAAWSRLLSPQAMLEHQNDRLSLLKGGGPDRPERLQSMRGAIGWSFDQLTAPRKALFRRISVCVDGCSLVAAAAVATLDSPPASGMPVFLDDVVALVDHSLVQREESAEGAVRVGMLETIREFGHARLVEAGEEVSARNSHAMYFLKFAKTARAQIEGPARRAAHADVQRELDNLRAALTWLLETGDASRARLLASELSRFWIDLGYIGEGRRWIEQVIRIEGASSPEIRVDALYWAAGFANLQGDSARATERADLALALAQECGHRWGEAAALTQLGEAAIGNDSTRARTLVEKALEIFREIADPIQEGLALRQLGIIAHRQGAYDEAAACHEAGLEIWRGLNHPWGVPAALRELADVALAQSDLERARKLYQESLVHWRVLRERIHMSACLPGLARVELLSGDGEHAVLLLGAQDALNQSMGYIHTQTVYAELIEDTRAAVSAAVFDEMWAYGESLPLEAVLDAVTTIPASPESVPAL